MGRDRSRYARSMACRLLSEALNYDFQEEGMDEAFSDEELEGMSGMQAMRNRVMERSGRNPTVRDFLDITRRGRPREAIIGSGKDIADRLEEWFTEGACDGYVIAGTHTPGTFEDFVKFVVPELQRRGLSRRTIRARPCARIWDCPGRSEAGGGHRRRRQQMSGTNWQISGEYMESCNCDYYTSASIPIRRAR